MKTKKITLYSLIIIGLSLLFFFLYSYTTWAVWWPQFLATKHLIFNWPDANANYFFAEQFGRFNSLFSLEYLNFWTDNLFHTRSINVIDGFLVPMTFLPGLIIFGLVYKLLGPLSILFLTPFLASATVYIIFQLFYKIFKDLDLSFVIALLLLPLAPWLFFANVAMLTTILFIFLLSFGLLSLFIALERKNNIWFIVGIWLVICAMATRPMESIWVLAILIILYYFHNKKISRYQLWISGFIFLATFITTLLLNKAVYGSWLAIGYLNLQTQNLPTEFVSQGVGFWTWFKLVFLPFGWNTKVLILNVWHYLIKLIWPYYLLVLLSLIFLKKELFSARGGSASGGNKRSVWWQYFLIAKVVFILIIIYYANWDLADPLVKQYNTISISYVRYFLPLYILILPFVAKAILGLANFRNKYFKVIWSSVLLIGLGIFSAQLAFFAPHDGLVKNENNLLDYYQQFARVKNLAPANSVMITERSDKIFFPYYKIVVPQGDLPLWPRINKIIMETPVYFYTSQTEEKLEAIKQTAALSNLELIEIAQINNDFKLMKIELIQ